ncbi:MAG: AbrB/MazE/SpoVT family DNA-binding domain-containing protein [Armatimonadetes bacterium]|nr:AbrB/MazE/SpoVT family DNA-binding domain-containing protein [Armatimonadota bacterium]
MKTRVVRWGHRLAVRIPAQVARELGWQDGTEVELKAGRTGLRVVGPGQEGPTLEEML